jgi:FkbM family methyltransferase
VLKRLIRQGLASFGLELRRKADDSLPFIHTVRCGGEQFPFWIANQHARRWWHRPEVPLDAEMSSLRAMCPPGSIVLEVGSHHGFFTTLLGRWAGPQGQVHAFEANAANALVLGANINLNRLTHCTSHFAAVGSRPGTLLVRGEAVATTGGPGREVKQLTLDGYCEEQRLARVDLLKIDVEGFEAEVLRGARGLLERGPRVALELHLDHIKRFGESARSVLQVLPTERYRGEMMTRPSWHELKVFRGPEDLPAAGVVNLFLWPKE